MRSSLGFCFSCTKDKLYGSKPKFHTFSSQIVGYYEIHGSDICCYAGTMISDLKPTGEITFEARVTNSNKYGYAIETIIDGKLLHGMLFSCTSNLSQDNHAYHKKYEIAFCFVQL